MTPTEIEREYRDTLSSAIKYLTQERQALADGEETDPDGVIELASALIEWAQEYKRSEYKRSREP